MTHDTSDTIVPPEAVSAALAVLQGGDPDFATECERRWDAGTWRAAIRKASASNGGMPFDLKPGTVAMFNRGIEQSGQITDRIEGARKVLYRVVNPQGMHGLEARPARSGLIDAREVIRTVKGGLASLYPEMKVYLDHGSGEYVAVLASRADEELAARSPLADDEMEEIDPATLPIDIVASLYDAEIARIVKLAKL